MTLMFVFPENLSLIKKKKTLFHCTSENEFELRIKISGSSVKISNIKFIFYIILYKVCMHVIYKNMFSTIRIAEYSILHLEPPLESIKPRKKRLMIQCK